ncbi:MAG: amidase [Alphaproteobacteria bacterium]|nr:amidase [Alphaproteobacteria bacterium]
MQAAGKVSAEGLAATLRARIEAREHEVGAFAYLDAGSAQRRAAALDEQARGTGVRGALHGIWVGIKDIIDTADMPTTYGSAIFAGHRPERDAACVTRLRTAGAVLPGKTVTTEFAYFAPGKTRNPRRLSATPGGSSSGSAAAVADGMVPLALATQTAGSIIRPAAYCGVVGFKPSHGTLDITGVIPFAPSLDTLGLMARSVEDAAYGFGVLRDGAGLRCAVASMPRLGFWRTPMWDAALPETRSLLAAVKARANAAGARVEDVGDIELTADVIAAQVTIMQAEGHRQLAAIRARAENQLSPRLLALLDAGGSVTPLQEATARHAASSARIAVERALSRYDAVIVPAAPGEAPEGLAATGDPIMNRMWTLLGTPCIALPAGHGPRGLPLGVQLVARCGDDERLLSAARWIERAIAAP